jgi:hypothetical protein
MVFIGGLILWLAIFLVTALFLSGLGCLFAATDRRFASASPIMFSAFYATLSFSAAIVNLFILLELLDFTGGAGERANLIFASLLQFVFNLALGAYFGWRRGRRVALKQLAQTP